MSYTGGFVSLWVIKMFLFRPNALTAARFDALVGAIRTVFVSVTLPALRDAKV